MPTIYDEDTYKEHLLKKVYKIKGLDTYEIRDYGYRYWLDVYEYREDKFLWWTYNRRWKKIFTSDSDSTGGTPITDRETHVQNCIAFIESRLISIAANKNSKIEYVDPSPDLKFIQRTVKVQNIKKSS